MQANAGQGPRDVDLRQIDTLCNDLTERAEIVREEQALLGQLVERTEHKRPFQARQYRALLEHAHGRYRQLRELIIRYCT